MWPSQQTREKQLEEQNNGRHKNCIKFISWAVNMTALARAGNICKRQTRPLVREGASYQQTPQLSDSNKNLVLGPRWVLHSKTDRPTDRRS
jgi:hypothetical protein